MAESPEATAYRRIREAIPRAERIYQEQGVQVRYLVHTDGVHVQVLVSPADNGGMVRIAFRVIPWRALEYAYLDPLQAAEVDLLKCLTGD